jgi:adenylate cyclase
VERKLTAILCADVHGYSRLMGENEEATLRTLSAYRKIIDSLIENHRGRFVNSAGDSVLAEFTSVVEAANCAVEIQSALRIENATVPPERRMEFRIGVNLGDVMIEGEQIYGDGVNVAARLESLAHPGGICIAGTVYEQVRDKLALSYQDLGEQTVKNIARPVHVWRIVVDGTPASVPRLPRQYWRGGALSLAGLAIAVGTFVLVQHLSLKPPHTSAPIRPAGTKQNSHWQDSETPALPSIQSIAVLPFRNLSGNPQQEYFSDGISEQLINELSRLPGLFVIARNSSFAYKGKPLNDRAIGRELGVRYLLQGSVSKAAEQVRISTELVDAPSASEVWTARYDRPLKDILAVQDEIVRKVITTLGLIVSVDQLDVPHWRSASEDNLQAFDDLLQAERYGWRFTKDDNARAREWAEKAIALDPKSADAYAQLGWIYFFDAVSQWTANPQATLRSSIELAQKALLLDDSHCSGLALLSNDYKWQGRFDEAVAMGERAVNINPNCSIGYTFLAASLNAAGRPAEALGTVEKAMRLDPAGRDFYAGIIGTADMLMGRYQQAIPSLQRTTAAIPNALWAHLQLAVAYSELGRDRDARAEAAKVMTISPGYVLEKEPYSVVPDLAGKDVALQQRFNADLRKAGLN